jgi:hypothetical protein
MTMDEINQYNRAAIDRQTGLVKSIALSLSRYCGFEQEFLSRISGKDIQAQEEKYKAGFFDKSAAALKTVEAADPKDWEGILENSPKNGLLQVHPYVDAFNGLARGKGLLTRVHDTGPKDYCIAKIKARKLFGGDVSKLDDVNRIMIESSDPETHRDICKILSSLNADKQLVPQERRLMQGFVSDVYRLKFADGAAAEIAFVPASLVFSSKITHNALRFRRACKGLSQDGQAVRELYKNTCESIKKAFNAAAHELKVDKKHLDALNLKEFNLAAAHQSLKSLEDECLNAVLNKPENKAWKSFINKNER